MRDRQGMTNDKVIKTLTELMSDCDYSQSRGGQYAQKHRDQRDAVKHALESIRELTEAREMLAAAHTLKFNKGTYIVRLGSEPYEYGVYVEGIIGDGDYSSWLEAYLEVKNA